MKGGFAWGFTWQNFTWWIGLANSPRKFTQTNIDRHLEVIPVLNMASNLKTLSQYCCKSFSFNYYYSQKILFLEPLRSISSCDIYQKSFRYKFNLQSHKIFHKNTFGTKITADKFIQTVDAKKALEECTKWVLTSMLVNWYTV